MLINRFNNVAQYRFPDEGKKLGSNIYAILLGKEAILVDTGYENQFLQVKENLESTGYSITKVIMTHFHPDHVGGLKHLSGCEIYGSVHSTETLTSMFDDIESLKPTVLVDDELTISIGSDELRMVINPSHSKCSMYAIYKKNIFVGDECMFFDNDEQCIPFAAETVEMHLNGLIRLREVAEGKMLMPAHGKATKCTLYMKFSIMYLRHLLKNPEVSYQEFSDLFKINFRNEHWHEYNVSNLE